MIPKLNDSFLHRIPLIVLLVLSVSGFKWGHRAPVFDSIVPVIVYAREIPRADGLVIDSGNNLYIASEKSHGYVLRISPDGQRKTIIKKLDRADGITIDGQKNIYISAETTDGYITRLTPEGKSTKLITGITNPEGIVFDSQQRLYIAEDSKEGRILRYENGQLSILAEGLKRPEGITIDRKDNLYINETLTNKILILRSGQNIETYLESEIIKEPDGITYCPAYDGLFVTEDQHSGRLFFIDRYKNITTISKKLSSPQGLACDRDGNLFISEQGKNRILKISAIHLRPLLVINNRN